MSWLSSKNWTTKITKRNDKVEKRDIQDILNQTTPFANPKILQKEYMVVKKW